MQPLEGELGEAKSPGAQKNSTSRVSHWWTYTVARNMTWNIRNKIDNKNLTDQKEWKWQFVLFCSDGIWRWTALTLHLSLQPLHTTLHLSRLENIYLIHFFNVYTSFIYCNVIYHCIKMHKNMYLFGFPRIWSCNNLKWKGIYYTELINQFLSIAIYIYAMKLSILETNL